MFDYVNYKADCKKCGEPLKDFQTKNSKCEMETVEPSQVDNFYTSCDKCKTWHDYYVCRTCVVDSVTVETSI